MLSSTNYLAGDLVHHSIIQNRKLNQKSWESAYPNPNPTYMRFEPTYKVKSIILRDGVSELCICGVSKVEVSLIPRSNVILIELRPSEASSRWSTLHV